ncbi:SMP-30/gluconolactonase/LRE family protein [Cryobacterium sp. Hb1]|uniref:SMP-30/gluconolactonase/LRE family protein n=1 Tax=Cryobacterium sp. Hb1 TaxID=1259147 RepID=UPI00106AB132|nr:superoxide dismutase [Cryobacterium sp. Hb1]TFD66962.1 superoxide dismutase [Cryobacterium sp. Hb1]
MISRIVARTLSAAALGALFLVSGIPAVHAAAQPQHGHFEQVIALPNGFQPEGIAIGPRGTAYVGSLADGDVYVFDVRTGEKIRTLEGPGTPSVGLKIDNRGRLFIAGGPTGQARVVDAATGDLLQSYALTNAPTFVNDVVLTRDAAWFTDSQQAQLYKLPLGPGGALPRADAIEVVPLSGSWMQQPGFNANGIAETPNHQALLVIQSSTGILFRVDPETGAAAVVDLGGGLLPNGDGLLVVGRTLYVVQNQLNTVAVIRLNAAGTSGELIDRYTDPDFQVPTTIARFGNGLYLPNARFGTPPTPDTPYSVVRIDR